MSRKGKHRETEIELVVDLGLWEWLLIGVFPLGLMEMFQNQLQ